MTNFYDELDKIMRQDFGNRGLLSSLPAAPVKKAAATLLRAERVVLLTGFPVRLKDGSFIGETDGPSGTANLAAALTDAGCSVYVVTDAASYNLLDAVLSYRAPLASLTLLPNTGTEDFIRNFMRLTAPDHFISLERPGKASDGHFHNMRGEVIDDMTADSSLFLSEAQKNGAVTISIGDGGNEMGMGTYRKQILNSVPSGDLICTAEAADITLACGVSNWWGWGISALLSHELHTNLLPSEAEETETLRRAVNAGAVDGCSKACEMTVDGLSLGVHLSVLRQTAALMEKYTFYRHERDFLTGMTSTVKHSPNYHFSAANSFSHTSY